MHKLSKTYEVEFFTETKAQQESLKSKHDLSHCAGY